MRDAVPEARSGHGWWPYAGPYFGFLLTVEIAHRTADEMGLAMLVARAAVPLALIAFFWRRGAYPELRGFATRAAGLPLDIAVGVASAALWMTPYLLIPSLRPEPGTAFNPAFAGDEQVSLVLALRFAGYALVTPLFEELFIRSFVMRLSEVWGTARDFRDVPIAHYSARSFAITVLLFTMGHVPWEYWVAIPWVVLTNLWFYWRGHIGAVIALHAAANASILGAAIAVERGWTDLAWLEAPVSLWFFL